MTEETIDVERMMLGIDDEDSHVTIPWINSSDRMPLDDEKIILDVLINEESNRHLI